MRSRSREGVLGLETVMYAQASRRPCLITGQTFCKSTDNYSIHHRVFAWTQFTGFCLVRHLGTEREGKLKTSLSEANKPFL